MGEDARGQDFGIEFWTKLLIRFFRLERRAFAVFLECLKDGGGVVGEVNDNYVFFPS